MTHHSSPFAITPLGLLGATVTIVLTTVENCVWLPSFILLPPPSNTTGTTSTTTAATTTSANQAANRTKCIVHALLFVATFVALATTVSVATVLLNHHMNQLVDMSEVMWDLIGALLCWALAGFLYYQAWSKRQRKLARKAAAVSEEQMKLVMNGAVQDYESLLTLGNDTTGGDDKDQDDIDNDDDSSQDTVTYDMASNPDAQPWLVVSLTLLGSFDEVLYFPAVILGRIFTPAELILGTLAASLVAVFIVIFLMARIKPLVDLLNRIPLYGIVAVLALLITLQVVYEWVV